MEDLKIVNLPPMKVARFYGFGPNPEDIAFGQFNAWAEPRGLAEASTYGFDNPVPSPGSPNYGYEVWFPIEDENTEGVEIKEFAGGRYAVTRYFWCDNPGEGIPRAWAAFSEKADAAGYRMGSHQWLEKSFSDETGKGLELMLPLAD